MNVLAVVVAAAASFALGGLWYSPRAFGTVWNRENGRPDNAEQPPQGHGRRVFAVSFLFALIAAALFA